MARHLYAFYASETGTALAKLAPLSESVVNIDATGKTVTVPLPNISAAYGNSNYLTRFRIESPSLQNNGQYISIDQVDQTPSAVSANLPPFESWFDRPIPLITNEKLDVQVANGGTAIATTVVVWFDDGNNPLPSGKLLHGIRATATTTLSAGAWTLVTPTFDFTLPPGSYVVCGMRAISTGCMAARVVLPNGGYRMGVLGTSATTGVSSSIFRDGRLGGWGSFTDTNPLQIEMLSLTADTAETFELDLIKTS